MPLGGRDLDSGDDEKPVHGLAVRAHESCTNEVNDGLTGVVVGHRETVQALFASRRDQRFRAGNAVGAEKRVTMQVEVIRHRKEG